jgi:hypothetical protein
MLAAPGPLAAPDPDVEAVAFVLDRRDEADVVGLGVGAVVPAADDRYVELAREVGVAPLADEAFGHLPDERPGVEDLVRGQPGHRAGGDVPDVVHPSLAGVEAHASQAAVDLGEVLDAHPAQLDLLARGHLQDVPVALVRDLRQLLELHGLQATMLQDPAGHHSTDPLPARSDQRLW